MVEGKGGWSREFEKHGSIKYTFLSLTKTSDNLAYTNVYSGSPRTHSVSRIPHVCLAMGFFVIPHRWIIWNAALETAGSGGVPVVCSQCSWDWLRAASLSLSMWLWLRGQQAVASGFSRCNERKKAQGRISWGKEPQESEQAIKVNTLWVLSIFWRGPTQQAKRILSWDHLEFLTHNEWMTLRLWKHFLALWFSVEKRQLLFSLRNHLTGRKANTYTIYIFSKHGNHV